VTQDEFDDAIELLKKGGGYDDENAARVYAAVGFILKNRRGVADDQMFEVRSLEVYLFLSGSDRAQMKSLKKIADGLRGGVEH
jgi:hypothetical protein